MVPTIEDPQSGRVPRAAGSRNHPPEVLGYPIVIAVDEGGRSRVVATGVYMPARFEEVRFGDLTPAEKAGVSVVLGGRDEEATETWF